MKDIILELIKMAKEKGLGDVCLFVSVIALIVGLLNSAGFHPLDLSKAFADNDHTHASKENK